MQAMPFTPKPRPKSERPTVEKCLQVFETYKRTARPAQIDALKHLEQEWDNFQVHLIRGPVGVGKSLILRAVQEVTRGGIITPSNVLVDQYEASFPDLNVVKGRKHYKCFTGSDCDTATKDIGEPCCRACPYIKSRSNLDFDDLSVFNPVTYFNLLQRPNFQPYNTILIDEAHTLPEFLRSLYSRNIKPEFLPIGKLNIDTPAKALELLMESLRKIRRLVALKEEKRIKEGYEDDVEAAEYLEKVTKNLRFNPDSYMVAPGIGGKGIQLISKYVPAYLVDKMLTSDKIVLASGTIFPTLVRELFSRDIKASVFQCENPIPAKQRAIISYPTEVKLNKDTPPPVYVRKINEIVGSRPDERGIIHMSYDMASKLEGLNPRILRHDKASKTEVKNLFLTAPEPLWLLASGMAEGLDLTEDKARVNVITKLSYPYLGDPYVKWRLDKPDGQLWYSLQTLTHLMQAVGRTTRSTTDYSTTYVLDPGLPRLFESIRRCVKSKDLHLYLPPDFMESVRF